MRWSYKTIHYEMKKEGLLGSAFLDESEIELSLNEYGKAGWELVSMLETLDGLIAVFKQPLSPGGRSVSLPEEEPVQQTILPKLVKVKKDTIVPPPRIEAKKAEEEVVVINEYEDEREEPEVQEKERPSDSSDVGSIRIE